MFIYCHFNGILHSGDEMGYRILIADDDKELLNMLRSYLEIKGYEVASALDGTEAVQRAADEPDLILLDVNMPHMDGLEVCRRIRDKVACPILFLTARVEEEDRVNGLLSGGDDYILKPFSLKELEARIIAHLKREERRHISSEYKFKDGLIIDFSARKVEISGAEIELTKTEYELVQFLFSYPGQVFDKERIYESICGYDGEGDSRVVTELVRRVRRKFSEHTQEEYIETVWGMGYRWKK